MSVVQTEILKIHASQPEEEILERGAAFLRAGALVAFPTETVYGLGGAALHSEAVEKIFKAKERPYSDPLIVHIAAESALDELVDGVPERTHLLARHFWPGPLTMILPARKSVPRLLTAGLDTVAIRMPRHRVALGLIRALGAPVAAPSANRFMHVSPTTAQHVASDLDGRVPLILDGGACEVGVESTILDVSVDPPVILRPGGVSLEALQAVLPQVQPPRARQVRADDESKALRSPGQMLIHYAPHVPAFLYDGTSEHILIAMKDEVMRRRERGEGVGVLIAEEDVASFGGMGIPMYVLGRMGDPERVASRLFAGLRTLEEAGVQAILCRAFPVEGLGLAVRDRLLKATGGKIITC
ncbi:L-threonylcarbamoyladenylate synthase [Ktedonospora formicarum]|uniref:Threonylcarbamoyl-AMP synthase n=1 Tax=Ktedonospora formicarum TaxID=2778364 RepID=A0A8J3I6H5_9CHLR|nr:L-threonylcarbamoyladenylate synthase [Ktedonospora formicarum]GHO45579.1 threonylcarbamoyl-AMP synthase [Ktedonospora formicarum]